MARRELSSTLKNLKFMQRAAVREEKTKREEEEIKLDVSIVTTPTTVTRKCVVIMEGDPHPGALKGRMSFQSFNPSVDKLNEEEARLRQPAAETTVSRNQNASVSVRENNFSVESPESVNVNKKNVGVNDNVKRKQSEVVSEARYPNKSPKSDHDDKQSLPSSSLGTFKKPGGDKLDWNVLRPSSVNQSR
ncbi:M-phase phosphoprotein 6 [Vigna radiata var. radiata]|uniref:M-phase phosphoprotein 6 n=1 Tax=Vigna radiata var. radiata TaxID=3916 RepID=A0A1S3TUE6_VIGRR|nr:M-phase phosphoprotein 6 [Vigna radiata var. radiata]